MRTVASLPLQISVVCVCVCVCVRSLVGHDQVSVSVPVQSPTLDVTREVHVTIGM